MLYKTTQKKQKLFDIAIQKHIIKQVSVAGRLDSSDAQKLKKKKIKLRIHY
jgi:hypothetical protein